MDDEKADSFKEKDDCSVAGGKFDGDNSRSDVESTPADSITDYDEESSVSIADENENNEGSMYPVEYIDGRKFVFVRSNMYPAELLEYFDKLEDITSDEYKEAMEIIRGERN